MTPSDPADQRRSIETRLSNSSSDLGVDINRLRRHFVFQRVLVRLASEGRWVLKGGFALEARLLTDARATKDLDLATLASADAQSIRDDLIDALDIDAADSLRFAVSLAKPIKDDQAGNPGWRFTVDSRMAGRTFAELTIDVVARAEEIDGGTEIITISAPLTGFSAVEMPTVDLAQHAAEKLHALTRRYGERPNSRVKDLIDLALLNEAHLLDRRRVSERFRIVCMARDDHWPPLNAVEVPASWIRPYAAMQTEVGLEADFATAAQLAIDLFDYSIGDRE